MLWECERIGAEGKGVVGEGGDWKWMLFKVKRSTESGELCEVDALEDW